MKRQARPRRWGPKIYTTSNKCWVLAIKSSIINLPRNIGGGLGPGGSVWGSRGGKHVSVAADRVFRLLTNLHMGKPWSATLISVMKCSGDIYDPLPLVGGSFFRLGPRRMCLEFVSYSFNTDCLKGRGPGFCQVFLCLVLLAKRF